MSDLFGNNQKPVIGMVHLKALPGSAAFKGDMDEVYACAYRDAQALCAGGIDALLVENDGDQPFSSEISLAQATALAALAAYIKQSFGVVVGISAAFNSYKAALACAKAARADFVRIPVFVDTVVTFCGTIHPCCAEAIKFRSSIFAQDVKILADVQVKYTHMLLKDVSIEESAKMAQSCGADAIIVTGVASGNEPPIETVRRAKAAVSLPVIIGSGSTKDNVAEQLQVADGVIIGTALKTNGRIDPEKVLGFIDAAKG